MAYSSLKFGDDEDELARVMNDNITKYPSKYLVVPRA